MQSRELVAFIAGAVVALTTLGASAEPITYAVSFIGSGSIGSTIVSHTAVTIFVAADTSQIQVKSLYYSGFVRGFSYSLSQLDPSTVLIEGMSYSNGNQPVSSLFYPTAPVNLGLHVDVAGSSLYGFYAYGLGYLTPTPAPFAYMSIADVTDRADGISISSDLGTSFTLQAFDPTLVPEPSSLSLLTMSGLICVAMGVRQSHRQSCLQGGSATEASKKHDDICRPLALPTALLSYRNSYVGG